jgi:hypothetical protein
MSYSIPVLFTVCDEAAVPQKQDCWHDAQSLMSLALSGATGFPLHSATGSNWSQIEAIRKFRNRDDLQGLEFIEREVAILTGDALETAFDSLLTVLKACEPETSEAGTAVDVRTTCLRIECDIDGGLAQFLTGLLGVLNEAIRSRRAFVFVQPQP